MAAGTALMSDEVALFTPAGLLAVSIMGLCSTRHSPRFILSVLLLALFHVLLVGAEGLFCSLGEAGIKVGESIQSGSFFACRT